MNNKEFEYVDDIETSSIYVMTRSTPPGTMPIKMKLKFTPIFVAFIFISLFIFNIVICKLQGRYFDGIISISQASVDVFDNHITSVIYPMNGFILSLITTVVVSYVDMVTTAPKIIIKMCRFFNLIISVLIIVSGTLTFGDSPMLHDIFNYCLIFFVFAYLIILFICLIKAASVLLSIVRICLILASAAGVFMIIFAKPTSTASKMTIRSIGEYVCVCGFLVILMSFYKEVSSVIIDVVVQEESKSQN